MGFAANTTTRTNLQKTIRNKQQLYSRCNRRFSNTTNPGERTFLKQEINRVVTELKQCARQWKSAAFGSTNWITSGYTPRTLTSTGSWGTRNSTKRSASSRTGTRTGSKARRGKRSGSRTNSKSRSTSFGRSRSSTFAFSF